MIESTQKNEEIKKSQKRAKVVFFCGIVLTIALIACTIVLASLIPKNRIYDTGDGSSVSSLSLDTDGKSYFSTTSSIITCIGEDNSVLETFDFNKELQKDDRFGAGYKVGSILNLNASPKSDFIWVSTTDKKLFKLERKDKIEIVDYVDLDAEFLSIVEDDEGEYVYVITKPSYMVITKYRISDLEKCAWGVACSQTPVSSNVSLSFLKAGVQGFEVLDDYLYIFTSTGFHRYDTSLKNLNIGVVLSEEYRNEYDLLYSQAEAGLEEGESVDISAIKAQAKSNVLNRHTDIKDFDPISGEVRFAQAKYNKSIAQTYRFTEWTSVGVALDKQEKTAYWVTNDGIYSYDLENISDFDESDIKKLSIELQGTLSAETGSAIHFNSVTGKAFLVYYNSRTLSFVDLRNDELLYNIELNYGIKTIIHDNSEQRVYYLYSDTVNFQSGTTQLKVVEIEKQLRAKVVRPWLITSAIALAVFAIITVIAFLMARIKKVAIWGKDVVRDLKRQWGLYLLLLASLIFLAMFCYYPAVGSIISSFFNFTEKNPEKIWNHFANYKNVFSNRYAAEAFKNMFIYLFFDLLFALVPPLLFAFLLTIMRHKGYSALSRTLLFIPGIIPGIATTLIWKTGIYGQYGVVNAIIQFFGGESTIVTQQSSTAIWALVFMGFPFVGSYLVFYGAMMNIPSSYYEAAELDGITLPKRFLFIDLPLILAQIKYVFILTFIGSVQNFGRTDLITNGLWGDQTPVYQMYTLMTEYKDYGGAAAYATILFLFLLVATVINLRIQTQDKGEY